MSRLKGLRDPRLRRLVVRGFAQWTDHPNGGEPSVSLQIEGSQFAELREEGGPDGPMGREIPIGNAIQGLSGGT
eukprot:7463968-Pyramimonas_sp.AAC.1